MKRRDLLISAFTALGVVSALPFSAEAAPKGELIYFGTHGTAIYAARLDPRTGELKALGEAAKLERPTWLVRSPVPRVVYSVSETGNDGKSEASVHSYRVDGQSGALLELGSVPSGGGGATHLAVDPLSKTVFVANYGTGQAAALPILAGGALGPATSIQSDYGSGPHRRQTSPHAHGVTVSPDGRHLLVPDLGADRTFVYKFDQKTRVLTPNDPPFVASSPGSGPRHAVFLPGGRFAYVNSELTGEITAYRWDAARGLLQPIETIPTQASDYTGERSSAEMVPSSDGRFLYASNRGEDTIVVFEVNRTSGRLTPRQRLSAGGRAPWSIALEPRGRWLLATCEASDHVSVFRVDHATGRLDPVGVGLAVPKPVVALFAEG